MTQWGSCTHLQPPPPTPHTPDTHTPTTHPSCAEEEGESSNLVALLCSPHAHPTEHTPGNPPTLPTAIRAFFINQATWWGSCAHLTHPKPSASPTPTRPTPTRAVPRKVVYLRSDRMMESVCIADLMQSTG